MRYHKEKYSLLIIDDDKIFCECIKDGFQSDTIDVYVAHSQKDGLAICAENKIDVVLLDQKLPDGDGHLLCPGILENNDRTRIIFATAFPSFDNAVRAIKAGAHDYLSKPFELEELRLALGRAIDGMELERVKQIESYRISKEKDDTVLIGDFCKGDLHELIRMAASVDSPVLITGETGTGKNVVARAIHFSDTRKRGPFISVNCAALPETLIEDELFGHEKGAFTDARSTRKGLFEIAEGGTLLLDEIGDMPLNLQSKLLGVLDEGKIRRLGGQLFIPVNVRIIATTNAQLEAMITAKEFRRDLYYRLSVIRIFLLPLRDRPHDIPQLCSHFIQKMTPERQRPKLPDAELERLMDYPWPGNVRELRNIIERSVLLHGNTLRPSELIDNSSPALERMEIPFEAPDEIPVTGQDAGAADRSGKPLEQVEREHIQRVLRSQSFNITRSAKVLGISLSTLKRKVKEYRT